MTRWPPEGDHVAVRRPHHHTRQLHDVEAVVRNHLGDALPVHLVDDRLSNLHQSGGFGGRVAHGGHGLGWAEIISTPAVGSERSALM